MTCLQPDSASNIRSDISSGSTCDNGRRQTADGMRLGSVWASARPGKVRNNSLGRSGSGWWEQWHCNKTRANGGVKAPGQAADRRGFARGMRLQLQLSSDLSMRGAWPGQNVAVHDRRDQQYKTWARVYEGRGDQAV